MEVEIHHDHFSNSERNDAHWLREVGQKGWIILTKDKSIGRNPIELKAIAEAEAKMFVLAANKNLRGEEIGDIFALSLEKLTRFAQNHEAPFIAKVYRSGSVKMYKSKNDLPEQLE